MESTLTFYHKSPDSRYISDSNWVGKTDMLTPSDAIDKYGYLMSEDELEVIRSYISYQEQQAILLGGYQNDGTFYDPTQSHEWNTQRPSLAMRQYT